MGESTGISWTTHTWNPWIGCQKVSPLCDNCYAESMDHRFGGGHWGPGAPRKRTSEANWYQPFRWNRNAEAFFVAFGHWPRAFTCSLADFLDNAVDPAWRAEAWTIIRDTKNLRWQIVTKRIGNVGKMLPADWSREAYAHVGLMISVGTQEEADRDIPKLLEAKARYDFAWVGLSMEPLLEGIVLRPEWLMQLDWVIVGGESGPRARPMHPAWAIALAIQCGSGGVPFFFKQWGEWSPLRNPDDGEWPTDTRTMIRFATDGTRKDGGWPMQKVGKKFAGDLLDGRQRHDFPRACA